MKKYFVAFMMILGCVFAFNMREVNVKAAVNHNFKEVASTGKKVDKVGNYRFKRLVSRDGDYNGVVIQKASNGKKVYKFDDQTTSFFTDGKTVYFMKYDNSLIYKLNIATKKVTKIKTGIHSDETAICHVCGNNVFVSYYNSDYSDQLSIKSFNVNTKKAVTITTNATQIKGDGNFIQYKVYSGADKGHVYRRDCNTGKTIRK